MTKTTVAVAIFAALTAAGGSALVTVTLTRPARTGASGERGLVEPEVASTSRLRPVPARTRAEAQRVGLVVRTNDDNSAAADDAESRTRQSFEHYFIALEAQRTGTPRDPTWSGQTEQFIRAFAASDKMAGAAIELAACGSHLCRVEIRCEDERRRKTAVRAFHRFVGSSLPQMTMYTPPGDATSIMYLARSGTPLPAMSETDLQAMQ